MTIRTISLMAGLLFASFSVIADDTTIAFDIPSQDLPAALQQFAAQADLELLFDKHTTQGKRSNGLKGRFTPREALQKMLSGTGLNSVFTSAKSAAIRADDRSGTDVPPTALPKVKVTATAPPSEDDPVAYNRTHSATATKTDTPIMETPLAIQVVPRQVLKDLQATRVEDALKYVSGVNVTAAQGLRQTTGAQGGTQAGAAFKLRGFYVNEYYRDGMRVPEEVGSAAEVAGLEQIEVLKGPASTLYGRAEPGGIINLVSKQTLATPLYALQQQFGSYGHYRTTVDAGGPLLSNGALDFRFNLAYQSQGSFQQLMRGDRIFVNPSLRWNISPRTQATLEVEYLGTHDDWEIGTIPQFGAAPRQRPAPIPRSYLFGTPGNKGIDQQKERMTFHWSHDFNDQWTLHHRFDVVWNNYDRDSWRTAVTDSGNCSFTGCTVTSRLIPGIRQDTTVYSNGINLTGKFDTWGIHHTLLMGGDIQNVEALAAFPFAYAAGSQALDSAAQDQSLFTSPIRFPIDPALIGPVDSSYALRQDRYGAYFQDQAELPYHIHLLAGFRYDRIRQTRTTYNMQGVVSNLGTNPIDDDAVKPRFGMVWRPVREFSLYGNFLENFGAAQVFQAFPGKPLPPENARAWEVGVKAELWDGRLTGSIAWFDLTKTNIAVPDPDPTHQPLGAWSILLGQANNKGLEIDLAGEILTGWKAILGYTYNQSMVTKATPGAFDFYTGLPVKVGNQFFGVPRHTLSLWNTYELQGGNLNGLKVGGGVTVKTQQENDLGNSGQVPGYATLDLMAAYDYKIGPSKLSVQLNVSNLTNRAYYLATGTNLAYGVGAPRSFLGSVRLDF